MVIVSTIRGRIRIRSRRLKSASTAEKVMRQIRELTGVTEVANNISAGSITVRFHAEETEKLEQQIEEICSYKPHAPDKNTASSQDLSRISNQVTKVGMVTTLAASLVYAGIGKKKLHLAYGTVFLVFTGLHMLRNSKKLLQ